MGGSGLVNMALYGGMMFTYSDDVKKKEAEEKAKECKKEEKKAEENGTVSSGEAGGGSGSSNVGGTEGGETQANGHSQTATVTPSPQPQGTPMSPTVTVTTTSVSCKGTSSRKTSDGSVTEVSYVSACNSASISGTSTSGVGAGIGIGGCSGIYVSNTEEGGTPSYEVAASTSLAIGIGVGVETPNSEDKGTSVCKVNNTNAVTVKAFKRLGAFFGISVRSRLKFSIKGSPKSSKRIP